MHDCLLSDFSFGGFGMKTDFETLKALAVYTVDLLKEGSMIEFDVDSRPGLIEALATELAVSFATDEDISDQALEEVEEKLGPGNLPEDVTESEMFNHARKEIIKSFSGENIGGLYLVESLHNTANRATKFLMDCNLVEEVYGADEDIATFLIRKMRYFSPPTAVIPENKALR